MGAVVDALGPARGRLEGKTALVTGSTSGIGAAIAELFAHEGAAVVVTGRNSKRGDSVVQRIEQAGGQAMFIRADITQPEDVAALVREAVAWRGGIEVLVNNAGDMLAKPLADISLAEFDGFVNLDGRSYFQTMQLLVPHMAERGGGAVLNVTSFAAINPMPVHSVYGFAKAGVTQMTRCIALEYAHTGVRVNSLLPGLVHTPMVAEDPDFDKVEAMVPMGRASTPIEQAYAALFLVSDEASYVTGASLVVNGGI